MFESIDVGAKFILTKSGQNIIQIALWRNSVVWCATSNGFCAKEGSLLSMRIYAPSQLFFRLLKDEHVDLTVMILASIYQDMVNRWWRRPGMRFLARPGTVYRKCSSWKSHDEWSCLSEWWQSMKIVYFWLEPD